MHQAAAGVLAAVGLRERTQASQDVVLGAAEQHSMPPYAGMPPEPQDELGPTQGATHFAVPDARPRERAASGLASRFVLSHAAPRAIPGARRIRTRRMICALRAPHEAAALRLADRARGELAAFRSAASAEWRSLRRRHSR
jgi:hypothetical protein